MPPQLFCFGLGYSAHTLARILLNEGWAVAGSARRADRLAALTADGIRAVPFDGDRILGDDDLAGATHLLISIPPDAEGDPVLRRCHPWLKRAAPRLRWIGYLSTTGVYGDHQGDWVDETTPTHPSADRSRRRVVAEQAWLDFGAAQAVTTHIFRLAGIYGPGRTVLDDIKAGTAKLIVKPGQFFSRIHVADIAQILHAAMTGTAPTGIFNVCDDEPAAPEEVLRFACHLLGVEPPAAVLFAEANLSAMAQSFWADNKRVRNDRLKQELGIKLLFPTYREGLARC